MSSWVCPEARQANFGSRSRAQNSMHNQAGLHEPTSQIGVLGVVGIIATPGPKEGAEGGTNSLVGSYVPSLRCLLRACIKVTLQGLEVQGYILQG